MPKKNMSNLGDLVSANKRQLTDQRRQIEEANDRQRQLIIERDARQWIISASISIELTPH